MEGNVPSCAWRGPLPDLLSHLQRDCQYVCSRCPVDGCTVIGPKLQVEQHSATCIPSPSSLCYSSEAVVVAQALTDLAAGAGSTV
jgi:hypothetical protein